MIDMTIQYLLLGNLLVSSYFSEFLSLHTDDPLQQLVDDLLLQINVKIDF